MICGLCHTCARVLDDHGRCTYGCHAGPVLRSELPHDAAERKRIPLCSGVLDYFPAALVEVAKRSQAGNDQHNPGQPLHWARGKSADHLDAALRHILERDLAGAAWRILAALQMECEANGAPLARGAREEM